MIYLFIFFFFFFFFKQKTAYEMAQCDRSSDVCSSDLARDADAKGEATGHGRALRVPGGIDVREIGRASCRERVVLSRVDLGGRRIIKKKKKKKNNRKNIDIAHEADEGYAEYD